MANNKSIKIFSSASRRKMQKQIEANKRAEFEATPIEQRTRSDYYNAMAQSHKGIEVVQDTLPEIYSTKSYSPKKDMTDIKYVEDFLTIINKDNLFDSVVSSKPKDGATFMKQVVELERFNFSQQNTKTTGSYATFTDAVNYFNSEVSKDGQLFTFDLETIGAKNSANIWAPIDITEYSMHKYDFKTKQTTQTDIFLGMEAKKAAKLQEEVIDAITNGTLDKNEDLKVTAMRMAMYGHDKTKITPNSKTGLYEVTNFVDSSEVDIYDTESIKRGFKEHTNIHSKYIESNEEFYNKYGITIAEDRMLKSISSAKSAIKNTNAQLATYNGTAFDNPITNMSIWNKYNQASGEGKSYIKDIFDNDLTFNIDGKKHIDLLQGTRIAINNSSVEEVYAQNLAHIKTLKGKHAMQEGLASFFGMAEGAAHVASNDVKTLQGFLINNLKVEGLEDKTFLQHITDLAGKGNIQSKNIQPGQQLFKANTGSMSSDFMGQGHLNFAYNNKTGAIGTANGYMMGGTDIITNNKGISKESFNLGAGLNKGAFYKIQGLSKVEMNDTWGEEISKVYPEYANKELYAVKLAMELSEDNRNGSLDDITQVLLFKSQNEAEGYISSNLNLVGEYDENGVFKILDNDAFEMNIFKKGSKVNKMNNNASTDAEIKEIAVKAHNEKLITDRARNSIVDGKNSYKKISNTYWLDNKVKELLGGEKVSSYQIATILSEAVTQSGNSSILKADHNSILAFQQELLSRVGYDVSKRLGEDGSNRLLPQTMNNIVNSYEHLIENRNVYEPILQALYSNEAFENAPSEVKDRIFKNAHTTIIEEYAAKYYNSNDDKIRNKILGSTNRRMTTDELKNIYEIDMSNILGTNNISHITEISQDGAENILKIDLNKGNFGTINKALKILRPHEDLPSSASEEYAREAVINIVNSLQQSKSNSALHDNEMFNNVRKVINTETDLGKYTFDPYLQMNNLIKSMKTVKNKDAKVGLVSKNVSMKTLTTDTDFVNSLVKEVVDGTFDIQSIIKDTIGKTNMTNIASSNKGELFNNAVTKTWVENNIMGHIMPNREEAINSFLKKKPNDKKALATFTNLYDINRSFYSDLYSDVIEANVVAGYNIQYDPKLGLIASNNSETMPILNMPKTSLDKETGSLTFSIGSSPQKFSLETEMIFGIDNSGNKSVRSVSNVESAFDYRPGQYTANTKRRINQKGKLSIKDMERIVVSKSKFMRENSVVDSFSPGQLDNNLRVNISNILESITSSEDLESLLGSMDFIGQDVKEKILKMAGSGANSPVLAQAIAPNAQNMALSYAKEGTSEWEILKNLNFSGKDKQVASYVGYSSNKITTQAVGALNDNKRQLESQTGNFNYIREKRLDDLIEKTKNDITPVLKKSFITSDDVEIKQSSIIEGVGKVSSGATLKMGYISTDAMTVMLNNTVESNVNQQTAKMMNGVRERLNTFEQQRFMDARIFEDTYGQIPDRMQKLGVGQDIVKAVKTSKDIDLNSYEDILDMIGNVSQDKNGNLVFKSGKKKIVNRGEPILSYVGYGSNETFASKIDEGILGYSFFNKKDTIMSDKEISGIINKYKNRFVDSNGNVITNRIEVNGIISEIMSEQDNITGQYNIRSTEKTTLPKIASDTGEKGMTVVAYNKTGEYDSRIASLMTAINKKDIVGINAKTNEAVELYLKEFTGYDDVKLNKLINQHGFSDINSVLKALKEESFTENNFIFDTVLKKQMHIVGNDAIAKHGNRGMVVQTALSDLTANIARYKYNNQDGAMSNAVDYISSFINTDLDKYGFIESNGKKEVGFTNSDGRMKLHRALSTDTNDYDNIDVAGLKNLIKDIEKEIDIPQQDRLYHEKIKKYKGGKVIEDANVIGQFTFGSYGGEDNVALVAKGYSNINMLNDPETQTSYTQDIINMKKRKIALETKQRRNGINALTHAESQELESLRYQISVADSTMKKMKVGDQELRIWNSNLITEDAIAMAESIRDGSSDKAMLSELTGTLHKDLIGQRPLRDLAERTRKEIMYNPTEDVLLTKDVVEQMKKDFQDIHGKDSIDSWNKEYGYLDRQLNKANKNGYDIGVNKAKELEDLEMARLGASFNRSQYKSGSKISEKTLLEKGYEKIHINDYIPVADGVALSGMSDKHLMLDLGEKFEGNRFVALPGLGKQLPDGEIKQEWHKKAARLKGQMEEFNSNSHSEEAHNSIKASMINTIQDIREASVNIYEKNGSVHNAAKGYMSAPSHRYKLTGAIGHYEGMELANNASYGYMNTAQVNGHSLLDWEKQGVYFDHGAAGVQKFKNMGYYDTDTLKKFGMSSEAEMTEYLKTHGTVEMFDRYPNIMATSSTPMRVFLDETLAPNEQKISGVLAMKTNADHDGDSGSTFLIQGKDGGDFALYNKAKMMRQENANADISGIISDRDYNEFELIENKMTLDAVVDNRKHANKVAEIISKDNIKNIDGLSLDNVVEYKGGKSILGRKLYTSVDTLGDSESFKENESLVNEMISKVANKEGYNGYLKEFAGQEDINVNRITGGVVKAIDESLSELTEDDDFAKYQQAGILRARQQNYITEMNSKMGLSTVGPINLSLNATKLASSSYYGDTLDDKFTEDLIWKTNYEIEQKIISSKKHEMGLDDTRVADYVENFRNLSSPSKRTEARKGLDQFLNTYIRDEDASSDAIATVFNDNRRHWESKGIKNADELQKTYLDSIQNMMADDLGRGDIALNSIFRSGDRNHMIETAGPSIARGDTAAGAILKHTEPYESTIAKNERQAARNVDQAIKKQELNDKRILQDDGARVIRETADEIGAGLARAISGISGSGLAMGALGVAAGVLATGYASGNPLNDASPQGITENGARTTMSVPDFMDQGGMVSSNNGGQGYVINMSADTKKGRKNIERMMHQAAQISAGGNVSVNMNIRNKDARNITDRDIENYLEKHM